jgi:ribonuclease D
VLWTPPATRDPEALAAAVDAALTALGARAWQVGLAGPVVTAAILEADQPPPATETPQ